MAHSRQFVTESVNKADWEAAKDLSRGMTGCCVEAELRRIPREIRDSQEVEAGEPRFIR